MSSHFTNAAPVRLSLSHVSTRLPTSTDTVVIEPGGMYCHRDRTVFAFVLGITGHRDARDPNKFWDTVGITKTALGDRLLYLLADLRRQGDTTDLLAGAFIQTLTAYAADAVVDRTLGKNAPKRPPQPVGAEPGRIVGSVGDWLTDRWRDLRPSTPNGYINATTRQPTWRGALTMDAGITLVPFD